MIDDSGFLQAIQEDREDTSRLIYADWLEETSRPARAEFIRLQCRLASAGLGDPGRAPWEFRCWQLLAEHQQQWAGPARRAECSWLFRRGFIEVVEMSPDRLLEVGEDLFRQAPVRQLHLNTLSTFCSSWPNRGQKLFNDLAEFEPLRQLDTLVLRGGQPRDSELACLCRSPCLSLLRQLDLGGNSLRRQACELLGRATFTDRLELLCLDANPLQAEGCAALAQTRFPALRWLGLSDCQIDNPGLAALARARWLPRLEALSLAGNRFNEDALLAFLEFAPLGRLRHLDLGAGQTCRFGARVARALARNVMLRQLERLKLDSSPWLATTLPELLRPPRLLRLEALNLSSCGLEKAVLRELLATLQRRAHEGAAPLRYLDLSGNTLDRSTVQVLADCSALGGLVTLSLAGCALQDGDVQTLARSPFLTNLIELDLGNNALGLSAARAIASSPTLRNLGLVRLNRLGDLDPAVIWALKNATGLPWLREVRQDWGRDWQLPIGWQWWQSGTRVHLHPWQAS